MEIKRSFLLVLAVFCVSVNAWATPPQSVTLTYDLDKQLLHVSAAHPTDKLDKHFLRRIVVYKNDAQVDTVNLPFQRSPAGVEQDIPVTAVGGDKLSVEISCSKGGVGKGEVNVPIPPKDETKK